MSREPAIHAPSDRPSERRMLLLSVRPEFAAPLISGEKRFELRRVKPDLAPGDTVWVYSTQPQAALLGGLVVAAVHGDPVGTLWRRVRDACAVSRSVFDEYFAGRPVGYAIEVRAPTVLRTPLTLDALRRLVPGFTPPRSYWYLNRERDRDAKLVRLLRPAARTLART